MTASRARSLRHDSATAIGVSRPSTTRDVRRVEGIHDERCQQRPEAHADGRDALQHPEDAGEDVGGGDPGDQGEATHVDECVARAHDREHDHRRRGRRKEADDDERRTPQGDAEPEPGRQPPGSHQERRRGGRDDRPGAEGGVEHSDAGVTEPHELHRDDDREDRDRATHEGLDADQGEEQAQVGMGVHGAEAAEGAVQRALGVGLAVVERGRLRMHPGHQRIRPTPTRRPPRRAPGRARRWRAGPR